MRKFYKVCIATLLLLAAGPLALGGSIGQVENFTLIGENAAAISSGPASAISGNMAEICQGQSLNQCCGLGAIQSEDSILSQSADAIGKCGILSVLQDAIIGGTQEQLATACSTQAQGQLLTVNLGQLVSKTNGEGTAGGAQGSVTDQNQSIYGSGLLTECQFIGATQYADVSGACGSDAIAANTLGVTGSQTQMSSY